MRKFVFILTLFTVNLLSTDLMYANKGSFTIKGQFTELPAYDDLYLYIYGFKGRERIFIDRIRLNSEGGFYKRIQKDLKPGLYEVSLNNTLNATVIISDKEDVLKLNASYMQWQTGYLQPGRSNENEALKLLRELIAHRNRQIQQVRTQILETDITHPQFNRKIDSLNNEIEFVYQIYNVQLNRLRRAYGSTYAAQQIFPFYLEPVIADFDSAAAIYDNNRSFLHRYFFYYLDLSQDDIIETPLFAEKINEYLDSYTHHTETGFRISLDRMLDHTEGNKTVQIEILHIFRDFLKANGHFDVWKSIVEENSEALVFSEFQQTE